MFSAGQWVPRLLILPAAATLFAAFQIREALDPRCKWATLARTLCDCRQLPVRANDYVALVKAKAAVG